MKNHKIKRIRVNGLYAVLSYHYFDNEYVYVPYYIKNIDGNDVKDDDIALVWRFPIISRDNIIKLKIKKSNDNVIKIPEKYISKLDGDVDGDCVCCVVLSNDFIWKNTKNITYNKIENTSININYDNIKNSRCYSFIDVLFDRKYNTWMRLYSDAIKRIELNEKIPKLPGSLYKYLIDLHINKYTVKDNTIWYNNEKIIDYHEKFGDSDIWITSVQEITKFFYNDCLQLKHPNINIDLDDVYSIYKLFTKKEIDYFEMDFGIKQTKNITDYNYFIKKYFSKDDFLVTCFHIILDGVNRCTKTYLGSNQ